MVSGINRDRASYTDPNGFVYWEDGRVYRQIYPHRAAFFQGVVAHPELQALVGAGKLASATPVPGASGLVLAHDTIWPLSYPQEWCAAMLRDAALVVLDMAEAAARAGYALADGHPWNVLFRGPHPRFIDWGSVAEPSALLWPAQVQFNRFLLYPLHLHAGGMPELARARLADLALGVDAELALRALPQGYKLAHPVACGRMALHRTAQRVAERGARADVTAKAPARAHDPAVLARLRPGFFAGIRREVEAIRLPGGTGGWEAYYADRPSMDTAEDEAKQVLLTRLLGELKPATVIDLGANTGRYSMLAARSGARVIAVDQDDASMGRLYVDARQAGLEILPLVLDLGNPTPATGWCAEQRPDAFTRLRAEACLMLAVIHHLVFTGNASLEQVARLADRAAGQVALIEWVGLDDAMARYLRRTATKDFSFYTEEAFITALEAVGFAVEALAPHAANRRMLVCRRQGL